MRMQNDFQSQNTQQDGPHVVDVETIAFAHRVCVWQSNFSIFLFKMSMNVQQGGKKHLHKIVIFS